MQRPHGVEASRPRAARDGSQTPPATRNSVVLPPPRPPSPPGPRPRRGPGRGARGPFANQKNRRAQNDLGTLRRGLGRRAPPGFFRAGAAAIVGRRPRCRRATLRSRLGPGRRRGGLDPPPLGLAPRLAFLAVELAARQARDPNARKVEPVVAAAVAADHRAVVRAVANATAPVGPLVADRRAPLRQLLGGRRGRILDDRGRRRRDGAVDPLAPGAVPGRAEGRAPARLRDLAGRDGGDGRGGGHGGGAGCDDRDWRGGGRGGGRGPAGRLRARQRDVRDVRARRADRREVGVVGPVAAPDPGVGRREGLAGHDRARRRGAEAVEADGREDLRADGYERPQVARRRRRADDVLRVELPRERQRGRLAPLRRPLLRLALDLAGPRRPHVVRRLGDVPADDARVEEPDAPRLEFPHHAELRREPVREPRRAQLQDVAELAARADDRRRGRGRRELAAARREELPELRRAPVGGAPVGAEGLLAVAEAVHEAHVAARAVVAVVPPQALERRVGQPLRRLLLRRREDVRLREDDGPHLVGLPVVVVLLRQAHARQVLAVAVGQRRGARAGRRRQHRVGGRGEARDRVARRDEVHRRRVRGERGAERRLRRPQRGVVLRLRRGRGAVRLRRRRGRVVVGVRLGRRRPGLRGRASSRGAGGRDRDGRIRLQARLDALARGRPARRHAVAQPLLLVPDLEELRLRLVPEFRQRRVRRWRWSWRRRRDARRPRVARHRRRANSRDAFLSQGSRAAALAHVEAGFAQTAFRREARAAATARRRARAFFWGCFGHGLRELSLLWESLLLAGLGGKKSGLGGWSRINGAHSNRRAVRILNRARFRSPRLQRRRTVLLLDRLSDLANCETNTRLFFDTCRSLLLAAKLQSKKRVSGPRTLADETRVR